MRITLDYLPSHPADERWHWQVGGVIDDTPELQDHAATHQEAVADALQALHDKAHGDYLSAQEEANDAMKKLSAIKELLK
jgi:hypothetical protein